MTPLSVQEKPAYLQGRVIFERPANLASFQFRGKLNTVGAFSYANRDTMVYDSDIGRYTSIAHKVLISPPEHPVDWLSTNGFAFGDQGVFSWSPEFMSICSSETYAANDVRTTIGNDVWIGANCFIKRGITIGDGAIIAAGAVVTKDVPSYSIMAGIPARLLRMRFTDDIIDRLTTLQWWKYSLDREITGEIKYSDIRSSLDRLETLVAEDKLPFFSASTVELTR